MAETPITAFPITMDVKEGSMVEHKALHKLSMVRCLRCGKKFMVHENTAVMLADDVPALKCPRCEYVASVLYYFPVKGGRQFARARHW